MSVGLMRVQSSPAGRGGGDAAVAAGYGFDGEVPGANVVVIPVPTSTTFLNGFVLCDVQNATASQIMCR